MRSDRPRDALCASRYDIYEDCLRLAASRPSVHLDESRWPAPRDLTIASESRAQFAYLARYESRRQSGTACCHWPDLIAHTGDLPTSSGGGWCTWTAAGNKLPTLRRSSGLYWAFAEQRHVSIRELYTAMGFPALDFVCMRPWMIRRAPYDCFPGDFSWMDAKRALGNSQHVGCVGAFMGALLLTCRGKECKTLFSGGFNG